jgi:hypothetical protein
MSAIFEVRFYLTGWVIRVGVLLLKWNRQENYKALSVEWVTASYGLYGGMTWREFRLARKQQSAARAALAQQKGQKP